MFSSPKDLRHHCPRLSPQITSRELLPVFQLIPPMSRTSVTRISLFPVENFALSCLILARAKRREDQGLLRRYILVRSGAGQNAKVLEDARIKRIVRSSLVQDSLKVLSQHPVNPVHL